MNTKGKFTDLFIQRPVLASVISLFILLLGLRAIFSLSIQEYPQMKNADIVVSTIYPGASAEVIQGFITTLLSSSIAAAEGIDYLSASSQQGLSTITAHVRLNYDPDKALVNVQATVLAIAGQLPLESQRPVLIKQTGSDLALMYIGYTSVQMTPPQIADYLAKAVVPVIQAVPGVGKVAILGTANTAMRIWVDPKKLLIHQLTATDVETALQSNNYQSAAGSLQGQYVLININAKTGTSDVEQFNNIVIKRQTDGSLVRISDVAKVERGADNYNSSIIFNGKKAVFVAVDTVPGANPLQVINQVKTQLPVLAKQYPSVLKGEIIYDVTNYISSSIKEVLKTIVEAIAIVTAIIFLFLGSLRIIIIPVITIPLSLIGVCSLMLAFGFSLNLLTLLAMVLAIGLVVDDAIVVAENIYRQVEAGMTSLQAALTGAREIATPVIAMSITLAAVYAPIAVMQGITGALFTEFAVTLAAAVIISGVIALTLSPMMCSKLLDGNISNVKFVKIVNGFFLRLRNLYQYWLVKVLHYRLVVLVFALLILASCLILAMSTSQELAPEEDRGLIIVSANAPQYAGPDYLVKYTKQLEKIYASVPDIKNYFIFNGVDGVTNAFSGVILKPWASGRLPQTAIMPLIEAKISQITGLEINAFPLPSIPGTSGLPVQFVVTTLNNYKVLAAASEVLLNDARNSGMFVFVTTDLQFNQPNLNVIIDRNKAADLGVSMQEIGKTLSVLLGENFVNRFNLQQNSYKVVLQLAPTFRVNPDDLNHIYVRSQDGAMVPLASLITFNVDAVPNALNQYQQLNAATIAGFMKPGFTVQAGLNFLKQDLLTKYPQGFGTGYKGESRQIMQQNNSLASAFALAIIIIFLVLAAQFESWRDPLIILISVPMSICGALILLNVGVASLNIYTGIGLVSLIGLISKHGILIVDFANKLRDEAQLSISDAIVQAAAMRLRPILMTTAATVCGVLPLIFSSGPGAASRFSMGIVIASGMLIGTGFTLFVVPAMYTYLTLRQRPKLLIV